MRYKLMAIPLAGALLTLSGCGYSVFDAADSLSSIGSDGLADGQPVPAQVTTLAPFDELTVVGPDAIRFTAGAPHSIRAEGSPELLAHLKYRLKDGTLSIGRGGGRWSDKARATIYVTGPALKTVTAAGSGPIAIDAMSGPALKLTMAGSGALDVARVQADKLDATMAGSGTMRLAGLAKASDISVAGSGDIDAGALNSERADVSVAGSGNVKLRSDGKVDASIMGSGNVVVTGNAACDVSTMGSGTVRCRR